MLIYGYCCVAFFGKPHMSKSVPVNKQIEDKWMVNPAQSDERVRVDIALTSVRKQQSPDLTSQQWSVIRWRLKAE